MTWFFFIGLEIIRNWFLIVKLGTRPHYGWSRVIRIGAGFGFLIARHPEFDPVGAFVYRDFRAILPATIYGLFLATSFYVLFDLILNKMRGLPWDYRGKNSGALDKLPTKKYYLLKAGSLVILILTLFAM